MLLLFSQLHVCVIMTNLDCIAFMYSDDNQWKEREVNSVKRSDPLLLDGAIVDYLKWALVS